MTTQTEAAIQSLPDLDPVPLDIDEHLRRLLRRPNDPALEPWLIDLIKSSGHMSTGDDMRWRVLAMVWLAQFNIEEAWPYLMWLNTNEPTITTHLSGILIEAIDDMQAHVAVANWLQQTKEERLQTFFEDFQLIPAQHKIPRLIRRIMLHPTRPQVGVWLAAFCRDTAPNESASLRPWRLLTAAWYAAQFNPKEGLAYLRQLSGDESILSVEDIRLLTEAAEEVNGLAALMQMIAASDDPAVRAMLQEVGHPEISALAADVLRNEPDYEHLTGLEKQAATDAEAFERNRPLLEQAGMSAQAKVLDLACGPLATQTLLFSSIGHPTVGVDLEIPPGYLPLPGLFDWFKRRRHAKAWQAATEAYYEALGRHTGLELSWKKAKIKLADLTRLPEEDDSYDVVICINYLVHAPDVTGLLAEAARVLRPGGLFLANLRPYTSLTGAFQIDPQAPWGHLRESVDFPLADIPLNRWREAEYRAAVEAQFTLEQWLPKTDPQTEPLLTPEIEAELSAYSPAELTRKQITLVAKKA